MAKSEERGFEQLVGLTIEKVDQSAINCVTITTTCGKRFDVQADDLHCGIPVVRCGKES